MLKLSDTEVEAMKKGDRVELHPATKATAIRWPRRRRVLFAARPALGVSMAKQTDVVQLAILGATALRVIT
jgi:hypothetical protein